MSRRAFRESLARWRPESPESLQLARWLRAHRLTVLIGAAPDDTTGLLAGGLLPLLGRRTADATVERPELQGTDAVVVPFRERRSTHVERAAAASEILILSDAAREPTLASLIDRFEFSARAAGCSESRPGTRLVQRMRVLSARHGSRFLFVLDNADALAAPRGEAAGSITMADALADMLTAPVEAHFVIAWNARAREALGPFLERLGSVAPMVLDLAPRSEAVAQRLAALPEPELQDSASEPSTEPFAGEIDPDFEASAADAESQPADTRPPFDRSDTGGQTMHGKRHSVVFAAIASVGLFIALGVAGWLATRQDGLPRVAALPERPAANTSQPLPPLTPLPQATLFIDSEGGPSPRIAAELAAALATGNAAAVTVQPGRFPPPATVAGAASASAAGPRLALVRYDVLSAAAQGPHATPFEVIAPLFTDELVALVHTDSPLRELSDLAGSRIDTGPPGTARSIAGEALYRSLFGTPPAAVAASRDGAGGALQRLGDGSGPDAVLLTGTQARELLPSLRASERAALRLLGWSTARAPGRAAAKTYLRASFSGVDGAPVTTPAALVFLVAAAPRDAAETRELAAIAGALCAGLGELKRSGDPKWREVAPGLQLPLPWRGDGAGAAAWSRCTQDRQSTDSSGPSRPTNRGDRP